MQSITFECEVITPMFLAGADGVTPELRPPSIKGALRFWWRALNGHLPLEELKEKEGKIFGDTKQRSKFNLIVNYNKEDLIEYSEVNSMSFSKDTTHILNYLSFGTWTKRQEREYIKAGFKFSFTLLFKINDSNLIKELTNVIYAFSLFGGLGMKSRNGFGSILIKDEPSVKQFFKEITVKEKETKINFHRFSQKAFLTEINEDFDSWEEALTKIGNYYKENNKIKWGKQKTRHAKSYFLRIKRSGSIYNAYVLTLPFDSPIKNYKREINLFERNNLGITEKITYEPK